MGTPYEDAKAGGVVDTFEERLVETDLRERLSSRQAAAS